MAHDLAAKAIQKGPATWCSPPPGKPCAPMPLATSRAAMRAAGKRVLIVGNCGPGAWGTWVHERGPQWDESDQGVGNQYPAFPACLGLRGPHHYDTHWMRWYEDSTWLAAMRGGGGFSTADEIAAMVRCGVQMPGMDQAAPDDGRLPAFVWSWAPDQPAAGGRCAEQGSDARFRNADCGQHLPSPASTWAAPGGTRSHRTVVGRVRGVCRAVPGGRFAAPPNGYRNQLIVAAKPPGVADVWVNYQSRAGVGRRRGTALAAHPPQLRSAWRRG